jgi:hypothetical protein
MILVLDVWCKCFFEFLSDGIEKQMTTTPTTCLKGQRGALRLQGFTKTPDAWSCSVLATN